MRLFAFVLVASLFQFSGSYGQSTLSAEIYGGLGFNGNIYNSPDLYVDLNGDTLRAAELVQQELFREAAAEIVFRWRKDGHYIRWETEGELRSYPTQKAANAEEIQSRLRYQHVSENDWKKGGEVRLRSQNRLGTNVLGSELLTPFSFRQVELSAFLERETDKGGERGIELIYDFKNYDICFGCDLQNRDVSLTQGEWEAKLFQEWKVGSNAGEDQLLKISARFRDRNYKEWINYELLDPNRQPDDASPFLPFDPDREYNPRGWRFMIFKTDYTFPLSPDARIIPFIEYTRRYDVSNGDFGFTQWQPGARLYIKKERYNVYAYASYVSRNYTDRLASQQGGVPFPKLEYQYVRARLSGEVSAGGGFSVFATGEMNFRSSNTTEITTRVRRSYQSYEAMLGLRWSFERDRKKPIDR